MVASVLNSQRAIQVSLYVVRAFVKLREILGTHRKLTLKLLQLENRVRGHDEVLEFLGIIGTVLTIAGFV